MSMRWIPPNEFAQYTLPFTVSTAMPVGVPSGVASVSMLVPLRLARWILPLP